MGNKNSDNKRQKNTEANKPQPFLKALVSMIGYGGYAAINAVRFPYFTIKKKAMRNREINASKELAFPLNGQSTGILKNMRIGSRSFASSGCGAIATFNALSMAGMKPDMVDIVDFYERKGLVCNAALGVNPAAVKNYLAKNGLTWKCYKGKQDWDACLGDGQAAIMLYFWVSPKGMGAHYVSMEKCPKGIRVYNVYGNRDTAYEFEDIQAFLESGNYKKVVSMFVIDRDVQ